MSCLAYHNPIRVMSDISGRTDNVEMTNDVGDSTVHTNVQKYSQRKRILPGSGSQKRQREDSIY